MATSSDAMTQRLTSLFLTPATDHAHDGPDRESSKSGWRQPRNVLLLLQGTVRAGDGNAHREEEDASRSRHENRANEPKGRLIPKSSERTQDRLKPGLQPRNPAIPLEFRLQAVCSRIRDPLKLAHTRIERTNPVAESVDAKTRETNPAARSLGPKTRRISSNETTII
jgi:hypothetical protein